MSTFEEMSPDPESRYKFPLSILSAVCLHSTAREYLNSCFSVHYSYTVRQILMLSLYSHSGQNLEDAPVHRPAGPRPGHPVGGEVLLPGAGLPLLRARHDPLPDGPQVHLYAQGARSCE